MWRSHFRPDGRDNFRNRATEAVILPECSSGTRLPDRRSESILLQLRRMAGNARPGRMGWQRRHLLTFSAMYGKSPRLRQSDLRSAEIARLIFHDKACSRTRRDTE